MPELNQKWIDPDTPERKPLQKKVEGHGYVAVTGEWGHKIMHHSVIHSNGLEKIDGKDWEMFCAHFTLEVEGKTYFYGMFVEGLGMFNVMLPAEQVRELTQDERKHWSGRGMSMVGSHTGKVGYTFAMPEL